jgi:hypothetical protein
VDEFWARVLPVQGAGAVGRIRGDCVAGDHIRQSLCWKGIRSDDDGVAFGFQSR